MDSGKRFEHRFAQALHSLPGASMRIEDGGARAKNYQFGDFFYWDFDGRDWLIECKATAQQSFPIRSLRPEQMAKLKTFDELGPNRHSVIAINFWKEPYRTHNDCVLIMFSAYLAVCQMACDTGRASIPKEWLERAGWLQAKKNGTWELDFERLLES